MGSRLQASTFRPDIEGLRAIAILLVVGYHAGIPGLFGGYVGVDIFFVLSGYLITGLLIGEIEQRGKVDFWRFYARRARRLLPALTLTLLVMVFVSWLIYPPDEVVYGGFATTALSTAMYASNIYFARLSDGYFAPDRENNPFLHTWSLSVEEQFYLVWPLFIVLALWLFAARNDTKGGRQRLCWSMAFVIVFSFALSLVWTSQKHSWAYFTSASRAWEFALGGLLVLLPEKGLFRSVSGKLGAFLGWVGFAGILIAATLLNKKTVFPGIAVLLPALSTVLILRGGAQLTSSLSRLLQVQPLQWIGRLSYSWYLWHWPVLVVGAALVSTPSVLVRTGLAALSLVLSAASYQFVESPIRNARKLAASHAYSLALAGLLAIIGISSSFAWRQTSIRRAGEPSQLRFRNAHNDFATSLLNDRCANDTHDAQVRPCVFGAESSSASIVLLGDSHGAHWFPALEPAAAKRGFALITIIKLGCPIVDTPLSDGGQVFVECENWRRDAIQKIQQIRPALTVVASTERYRFQEQEWKDGINRVVKSLAEASPRVLILRDTPGADFDIPSCLSRRLWRPSFIPSSACEFSVPETSKIYQLQSSAAAEFKNVVTADLSAAICPKGVCSGIRDNLIMFRDSDHFTESYARTLENALGVEIDRAFQKHEISTPDFGASSPALKQGQSRSRSVHRLPKKTA